MNNLPQSVSGLPHDIIMDYRLGFTIVDGVLIAALFVLICYAIFGLFKWVRSRKGAPQQAELILKKIEAFDQDIGPQALSFDLKRYLSLTVSKDLISCESHEIKVGLASCDYSEPLVEKFYDIFIKLEHILYQGEQADAQYPDLVRKVKSSVLALDKEIRVRKGQP